MDPAEDDEFLQRCLHPPPEERESILDFKNHLFLHWVASDTVQCWNDVLGVFDIKQDDARTEISSRLLDPLLKYEKMLDTKTMKAVLESDDAYFGVVIKELHQDMLQLATAEMAVSHFLLNKYFCSNPSVTTGRDKSRKKRVLKFRQFKLERQRAARMRESGLTEKEERPEAAQMRKTGPTKKEGKPEVAQMRKTEPKKKEGKPAAAQGQKSKTTGKEEITDSDDDSPEYVCSRCVASGMRWRTKTNRVPRFS
ncbi:unnamed protein product [Gongylonema pulchrum]|uniref:Cilia- and flagella-associated protein 36 n=1 Tax=Gongylonema pulchrum TaxID=637853 RepID=A0A183E8R6_9BILA|nr:unnamed protein product [Gongylonema pulchrum]